MSDGTTRGISATTGNPKLASVLAALRSLLSRSSRSSTIAGCDHRTDNQSRQTANLPAGAQVGFAAPDLRSPSLPPYG